MNPLPGLRSLKRKSCYFLANKIWGILHTGHPCLKLHCFKLPQPWLEVTWSWFKCLYLYYAGYLEQGLLVKEPKKLRRNYFKSGYIYVDVLSILPTDLAYFFLTTECFEMVPCPVIVRINRVIGHHTIRTVVNFTNILHAAFAPIFFRQKITKQNCN